MSCQSTDNYSHQRVSVTIKGICVDRVLYFKRLKKHNNQMSFVNLDKILVWTNYKRHFLRSWKMLTMDWILGAIWESLLLFLGVIMEFRSARRTFFFLGDEAKWSSWRWHDMMFKTYFQMVQKKIKLTIAESK